MKKIVALTNSRSDYDLMSYVYKMLDKDKKINFKLFVGGGHFSSIHNQSFNLIKKEKFKSIKICKSHVETFDETSRIKSAAKLAFNFSSFLEKERPNIVIYAGDREEVLVGSMVSAYLSLPSVHFFSGDHDQDGLVDNPVRHSSSILSSYCCVTLKEHKARLKKLGINKNYIKIFGNPALDKFFYEKRISRNQLAKKMKTNIFLKKYALVIHHPLMNFENESILEIQNILSVLKNKKIKAIMVGPNLDFGNYKIKSIMKKVEKQNKDFIFYSNLDREIFINIYRHCHFQIGNSSSGILESATAKVPAINVGKRMKMRKSNANVIFCKNTVGNIRKSVEIACSDRFRSLVKRTKNMYYKKNSSKKIYNFLKNLNTKNFKNFRYMDPLND